MLHYNSQKVDLMKIDKLIERNYPSVSVLEDMNQIAEWLRERDYFVVIDEDLDAIGVITLKDVNRFPCNQLIDCDFIKPKVSPDQNIFHVFKIMKDAKTDFLPVFERRKLIGVISLVAITETLIANNLGQN